MKLMAINCNLIISLLIFSLGAFASTKTITLKNRTYKIVTPSHQGQNKPLLVLLHGCKQSADVIIKGTGLDKEAEKRNFIILAPEQGFYSNADHCWNWFFPRQQMRHPQNEMGEIISAIDLLSSHYPIDRGRIFVAGLSAGGAMAENLAVCYPDYFTGLAVHSGITFKVAESTFEAQDVLTRQEQKDPEDLGRLAYKCARPNKKNRRFSKSIIIHGLKDERVLPLHAQLISQTHQVLVDYMDDGQRNKSNTPIVKIENIKWPLHYDITKKSLIYSNFHEEMILINELGHAWSGGLPVSRNFNPDSPSSNHLILNFFKI